MKRIMEPLAMGIGLLALSTGLYVFQIAIFHHADQTGFYLLQDLAFLPVQVLLVTLIVGHLLTRRERQNLLNKMNMVIGAFYAEVGTDLLRRLLVFDARAHLLGASLAIQKDWSPRQFADASDLARHHAAQVTCSRDDLAELRRHLVTQRDFLLRLLENPNLLEHNTFTDCLWAVFHLTDELVHRKDLTAVPDADLRHLAGDMERAYRCIVVEWLAYMRHLQRDYPYLFSLAVRTNPFDPGARVELT